MSLPKFSTREYVFAALVVAAQLVISSILIPITLPLRIPGLANTINAPFSSCLLVIGLARLRKPGSMLLMALIYALLCLPISPVIFSFILCGGLLGEAVGTFGFRGYRSPRAQIASVVAHQMGMFPAAMLFSFLFTPARFVKPVAWAWLVAEVAIATTSLLGALAGIRIVRELVRAGKLRIEA